MLSCLRGFVERDTRVDLFISNYVYEKVHEGTHTTIDYRFAIPRKKIIGWNDVGYFRPDQHLLMHSLCYRTDVLRAGDLPLPPHTFYVDNIYAYVPLPRCKTLYYADIDLYRYFIGREGQSVNESTMIKRIDQQFRITRIMMKAYHLYDDIEEKPLASCMMGYFTMMMVVCSIFSKLAHDKSKVDEVTTRARWTRSSRSGPSSRRSTRRCTTMPAGVFSAFGPTCRHPWARRCPWGSTARRRRFSSSTRCKPRGDVPASHIDQHAKALLGLLCYPGETQAIR